MGKHGVLGNNIEWIHLDSAGIKEDLLEPGDEAGLALLDQAILQHLYLGQLDLVRCILIG